MEGVFVFVARLSFFVACLLPCWRRSYGTVAISKQEVRACVCICGCSGVIYTSLGGVLLGVFRVVSRAVPERGRLFPAPAHGCSSCHSDDTRFCLFVWAAKSELQAEPAKKPTFISRLLSM